MGLYQIHWPGFLSQGFSNDQFVLGLAKCVQQGLTQAVGVSNFKAERVRRAASILEVNSLLLSVTESSKPVCLGQSAVLICGHF